MTSSTAGSTAGTVRLRQIRHVVILAVTAVLALTLSVSTVAPAQARASAETAITGTVSGINESNAWVGLPNVQVVVWPVNAGSAPSLLGTTDQAGKFTVPVPSAGQYRVQARCGSSTSCSALFAPQFFGQANTADDASTVTVASGAAPSVHILMPRLATITGRVVDTSGRGLAGQPVTANPPGGYGHSETSTDQNGAFTLTKVIPGKIVVMAGRDDSEGTWDWAAEYWNGTQSSTPVPPNPNYPVLRVGPTTTNMIFQLAPMPLGFRVTPVGPNGNRLSGMGWTVSTQNATTGQWETPQGGWDSTGPATQVTDTSRGVEWKTVVGGRYKICFHDDFALGREERYASRCWVNSTSSETATVLNQTASPRYRALRVTLPIAGKGVIASAPWVIGPAKVGSVLTVDPGAWGPTGAQLSYQWGWSLTEKGSPFVPVAGATATSFTPTLGLKDKWVSVRVTGALAGRLSTTAMSDAYAVGAGLDLTSPLKVTGNVTSGQVLTASHGTPTSGAAVAAESYQWRLDGSVVGWGKTLTLTPAMVGKVVTVRYSVRTAAANSASSFVATSGRIVVPLTAPVPTISGTAKVGSTLATTPGTWGPAPVTLSYQWKRAGVAIPGATASTYALVGDDSGKAITVTVTGTKTGHMTLARTSASTAAIAAGTLVPATPTITGTVKVGSTLTANPGTWKPTPDTLVYGWFRNGSYIAGPSVTYTLTPQDQGKTITVMAIGQKKGYTDISSTSAATVPVGYGVLTPTPVPTLTGTPKVGSTLTAAPGTWGPAPVQLGYVWMRNGDHISNHYTSTYTLTSADAGKTITVTSLGSKPGFTTVWKTSAPTAIVVP